VIEGQHESHRIMLTTAAAVRTSFTSSCGCYGPPVGARACARLRRYRAARAGV